MGGRCPKCGSAEIEGGVCQACGFPAGKVNNAMMRAYIVTGAMAGSVFIYAAVAVAITSRLDRPPTTLAMPLLVGLFCAALVCAVASAYVALSIERQRTPTEMFSRLVIAAALAESPAVYGLVLTLLAKDVKWVAIFAAVSLIAFAVIAKEMPAFARAVIDYVDKNPDAELWQTGTE